MMTTPQLGSPVIINNKKVTCDTLPAIQTSLTFSPNTPSHRVVKEFRVHPGQPHIFYDYSSHQQVPNIRPNLHPWLRVLFPSSLLVRTHYAPWATSNIVSIHGTIIHPNTFISYN